MSKRLLIALVAALAVAVSACGAPERGIVVGKDFKPAHTNVWTSMQCMSYNSNGTCALNMPVTHYDHVPNKWYLRLKNCEKQTEDGKCKYGWREVSHDTHDKVSDGWFYDAKTGEAKAQ